MYDVSVSQDHLGLISVFILKFAWWTSPDDPAKMGVKPSKFLKHSYVVSEGVQTDLSIQSCSDNDGFDAMLSGYKTPPRQIQRLSDPRSISRGIMRTPIMCESYDGNQVLSPVEEKRKPYLETDLDEVLLMQSPSHQLNDLDKAASASLPSLPQVSLCNTSEINNETGSVNNLETGSILNGESINIEIPTIIENYNDLSNSNNVNLVPDASSKPVIFIDREFDSCLELKESAETLFADPVARMIQIASPQIQADSSETVEQVCQRILDELLYCEDDIRTEDDLDSGEELFPHNADDSDDETAHVLRGLTILPKPPVIYSIPSTSLIKDESFLHHDNCASPGLIKFLGKSYSKTPLTNLEQPSYTPSPSKRKPLAEVNRNVLPGSCEGQFPVGRISKPGVDGSPIKSFLPFLHSQSGQHSKPHRSHWDTENTLII